MEKILKVLETYKNCRDIKFLKQQIATFELAIANKDVMTDSEFVNQYPNNDLSIIQMEYVVKFLNLQIKFLKELIKK